MNCLAPELIRLPFFLLPTCRTLARGRSETIFVAPPYGFPHRREYVFKMPCSPGIKTTRLAATLPHCAIEKQLKLVHPYLMRHGIPVMHTQKMATSKDKYADELFSGHSLARRNREKLV